MEEKIKTLTKKLLLSENRYEFLYDNSPDMLASVDPNSGLIINCNNTIATKLGYKKSEIIGQRVFFLFHQDSLESAEKAFYTFITTGRVKNASLVLVKKNKEKIPVLLNVIAVRDKDGNILYSNSSLRDISDIEMLKEQLAIVNKKLEEKVNQLESRNKELEQFAYVASHDLQEPLRTVSGFSDLLVDEYQGKLDETADHYLKFISEASVRMQGLVQGLLAYSQIGKDQEFQEIDCNQLLVDIKNDLGRKIQESQTTFEIGDLPILWGIKTELRLLFQNLITNAMKFRKQNVNTHIRIWAQEFPSYWLLACADNGIGIDPNDQNEIFTIFKRLHSTTEYEGTGIGLAHCHKIVKNHKGKIWVESEIDKGATFFIQLPKEKDI